MINIIIPWAHHTLIPLSSSPYRAPTPHCFPVSFVPMSLFLLNLSPLVNHPPILIKGTILLRIYTQKMCKADIYTFLSSTYHIVVLLCLFQHSQSRILFQHKSLSVLPSVRCASVCVSKATLIQNGKYPAIIIFDDRMLRFMVAAYHWTS